MNGTAGLLAVIIFSDARSMSSASLVLKPAYSKPKSRPKLPENREIEL